MKEVRKSRIVTEEIVGGFEEANQYVFPWSESLHLCRSGTQTPKMVSGLTEFPYYNEMSLLTIAP